MKYFLLLILVTIFSNTAYSQKNDYLPFKTVLSYSKNSLSEVEEFLTAKNWKFKHGSSPTKENLGEANFTFNDTIIFTYYYNTFYSDNKKDSLSYSKIVYQITSSKEYLKLIAEAKKEGYSMINAETNKNQIEKKYKNKNDDIIVFTNWNSDDPTASFNLYNLIIENYKKL